MKHILCSWANLMGKHKKSDINRQLEEVKQMLGC